MRSPGAGRRPDSSTTPARPRSSSAPRRIHGARRSRRTSRGSSLPAASRFPTRATRSFIAAWRLLGVDPANPRERDVTAAADLILRARAAVRLPVSRDPITAIAGGAVCLDLRRRGAGRHRLAPQPRGRRRLRHPLRRAEGGRSDGDRRACRASRRAAPEGGGGADRFSPASRPSPPRRPPRPDWRARKRPRPRTISGRCGRSASTTRSSSRRSRRNGRERVRPSRRSASRKASPAARPQPNPHPSRRTSRRQADKDEAMTARAPNILIVMADQMAPAFLPIYGHASTRAPNMHSLAGERRRVRQRLLQQPALLAVARLVHDRAACRRAPASTTTPRNSPPTSRPSPITCGFAATAPSSPARCTSAGRTSCMASRNG